MQLLGNGGMLYLPAWLANSITSAWCFVWSDRKWHAVVEEWKQTWYNLLHKMMWVVNPRNLMSVMTVEE